jgi:rhamnosyltransferase
MNTNLDINICSVVVLFKPKNNFLNYLKQQTKNFKMVIIVNNSPEISTELFQLERVKIINNSKNLGLAAALNIGVNKAIASGYEMVALFDQDTFIKDDFSKKMLLNYSLLKNYKNIALFAPMYFDLNTREENKHINFKYLNLIRTKADKSKLYHLPDYVITSGSIISTTAYRKIGPFNNELFIDFIDIEWCLRARKKMFKIIAFNNIIINHNLGDYSKKIFNKSYPIHSPIRMYYYFRNSIYLYKKNYVPLNWKIIDMSRLAFRVIFYLIFVKNRKNYFKKILKGIYHGFINKMGEIN